MWNEDAVRVGDDDGKLAAFVGVAVVLCGVEEEAVLQLRVQAQEGVEEAFTRFQLPLFGRPRGQGLAQHRHVRHAAHRAHPRARHLEHLVVGLVARRQTRLAEGDEAVRRDGQRAALAGHHHGAHP